MDIIKKSVFLLIATAFFSSACKKSPTCNGVPNVSVYANIDLSLPSYSPIVAVGGSMVVTGGYDNIILYHYTQSQFTALDCCCPYDGASNSKAIVQIQTNHISAVCPVCGSSFLLSNGSVNHGPATCPLKNYNTTYDGAYSLTVTN